MTEAMTEITGSEIAVIGMSCRFPGAKHLNEFWENLTKGVESNPFLSDEELTALGTPREITGNPHFVKAKEGSLENKEFFDAAFFGYTPKEAEIMDPQMRIFFENVWRALEDAGYDPGKYDGFIGVYTGAGTSSYWEYLASLTETFKRFGYFAANLLMNKDFVGTQVAYKLNLKGPCFSVQTACSTSLVAIHLACQGILNGECNMALAGGTRIAHQKWNGYIYEEGMISSPDGHCRAFDSRSKGIFNGEGCGVVLLKPLEEAAADGDHIYAVVKGTAINNDGLRKIGFTAPSIEGQAEAIRMAQQMAEIEPESIGYIEAHGTGTELGDPVEIEGLKLAFNTDKKRFCAIGSVKTNMGHLDAAAGAAGFIKTVLTLKYRLIPPSLHFETPNPRIDFENSPFYVNNRLTEWESNGTPRRAGVSSFGLGGTNAHVVLEEWVAPGETENKHDEGAEPAGYRPMPRQHQLILLSAKTLTALDRMTQNLANHFKGNPGINLSDAAYTLMVGRKDFEYRRMAVSNNVGHALEMLPGPGAQKAHYVSGKEDEKKIIFMFSGQGSQYVNMGLELYENEPAFREEMDRCFHILETQMGYKIREFLYPGLTGSGLSHEEAKKKIDDVYYSGPIKFTIEYSLAKLLMKWGIKPYGMIGHSFGEYAAARLAGVFSLEDALRMVVLRGKLMEKTPPGAMMSIPLPAEELKPLLKANSDISLAAINTPSHCIVSGPTAAVEAFEKELNEKGHDCLRINFPRASHSQMMKSILGEYEDNFRKVKFNNPKIPYIAGLTGDWITNAEAADPSYWGRHMAETIQFSKGIKKLLEIPGAIFVQVGCDSGLPLLVGKHLEGQNENLRVNVLRHPRENVSDVYFLLNSLGLLWQNGVKIAWPSFYSGERRNRIALPTYPFEGEYYWLDEAELKHRSATARGFGKKDAAQWFYVPSWSRTSHVMKNMTGDRAGKDIVWLLFIDDPHFGENLVKGLGQIIDPREIVLARVGENYAKANDNEFTVNPGEEEDYYNLFNELNRLDKLPRKVVHLWGITAGGDNFLDADTTAGARAKGFYSLLFLTRAMARIGSDREFEMIVVTNNIQNVTGKERVLPAQSSILGPVSVIPQEHRNIGCRSIDVSLPVTGNKEEEDCVDHLILELFHPNPEKFTAFRNGGRWIQSFHQTHLEDNPGIKTNIKENGTYLITGGLEGVGLILAEYFARSYKSKLVLIGESDIPGKDQWENWLSTHDNREPVAKKIKKVRELEELGGEVLVFNANPANLEEMQTGVAAAEAKFGPIAGIIHAAGESGDPALGLITDLDRNQCERRFNAKTGGLITLETVFAEKNLEFRLIISSVLSFLGGLENAAYTAADIFMDTFAQASSRWLSLNLEIVDIHNDHEIDFALSRGDVGRTVELVLKNIETGQIIVSTTDLNERIKRARELKAYRKPGEPLKEQGQGAGKAIALSPRPNLSGNFVMAVTETEKQMVKIWQGLLGYEEIGTEDNFFELGGNSLAAIEVKKRIKEVFKTEIPVVKILHYPTIHSLVENALERDETQVYAAAPREENTAEVQEELIDILEKF